MLLIESLNRMIIKDILEFIILTTLLAAIGLYTMLLIEHKIDDTNILLLYIALGLTTFSFIVIAISIYLFGIDCHNEKKLLHRLLT